MKFLSRLCGLALFFMLSAAAIWAQPRPVSSTPPPVKNDKVMASNAPTPAPAPASVKAKYEGGIFGYRKKQEGTLQFDENNNRLVFRTKDGKEMLSFPYSSLNMVYPDTKAVRPAAATVIGSLPLPYGANIPAWFVRKKVRYLSFQFSEPNMPGGLTSFKLENKETLFSIVTALCEKAQLTSQGDSCFRPRPNAVSNSQTIAVPLPRPRP